MREIRAASGRTGASGRTTARRTAAATLAMVAALVATAGVPPSLERAARAEVVGHVQNPGNGHYYLRVAKSTTWAQAKADAEALGGYLVTLTSATELNWVVSTITTGGGDVWVGATDSAQEGNWTWITGEPWSYSNWNSGEPNNSGGEHWIEMYSTGKWNDVPASHMNPGYIIEWDVDPNTPPPPEPPDAPTNLNATLTFQSTVLVQWVDNADTESAFEIERRTPTTEFTRIARPARNTTSFEDITLAPLTEYTYRVRAVNGVGPSGWSNEDAVTSAAFVPQPPAPSDLVVASTAAASANIQWTDNSDGEIGFEVRRRSGTGDFVYLGTTAANATTYHDAGLSPDAAYTWRVRAVGTLNPSAYVEVSGETPATLQVTPLRGDVKDTPKAGKDSLKITARWDFLGGAVKPGADPLVDGITLRAGPDAAPRTLILPPGFGEWKGKGPKYKWKSPPGPTKYKITLDAEARTIAVVITGIEWSAAVENPVRVSIAVGADAGTTRTEWTVKKPGLLQLR